MESGGENRIINFRCVGEEPPKLALREEERFSLLLFIICYHGNPIGQTLERGRRSGDPTVQ